MLTLASALLLSLYTMRRISDNTPSSSASMSYNCHLGRGTISRGQSAIFTRSANSVLPYPTNTSILERIKKDDARHDRFGDLYFGDRLWAGAMVTDQAQQRQSFTREESRDLPLEDLIQQGIRDRRGDEVRNLHEERAMKYSAILSSALLDHVEHIEKNVGWHILQRRRM
jgi:hypothetical protein